MKAIIFDLDDTLFDCYTQLVKPAQKYALQKMREQGLKVPLQELMDKYALLTKHGSENVFQLITDSYNIESLMKKKVVETGFYSFFNYFSIKKKEITLFPGTKELLSYLKKKYKLFIVTVGLHDTQQKKITALGLSKLFDQVYIIDINKGIDKKGALERVLKEHKLTAAEVMMIGNRRDSDIAPAKRLGMKTILIDHGEYEGAPPKSPYEEADLKIKELHELYDIV